MSIRAITDLAAFVLTIALVVALVRNSKGTSQVIGSSASGFRSIIRAATFQG